jgi:HSP20 family protein
MPISDILPWNKERDKYAVQRRDQQSPFDFQEEMNRMIADFFQDPYEPMPMRRMQEFRSGFYPRMDISETEKEFRISSDMPGMDEKDINISLENDILTISGEKKVEREETGKSYYRAERRVGAFKRSIELPTGVDIDKIDARFSKGVLEISIPKPEQTVSQKKKITVKPG